MSSAPPSVTDILMVTRHILHQGPAGAETNRTAPEQPHQHGGSQRMIPLPPRHSCGTFWRSAMETINEEAPSAMCLRKLHFSGFLPESWFSLGNTKRAALSLWETLMWLQINFSWAHSIWKRSHSSKDRRRKLNKNSNLRHNFATGSSALKPISRCCSKACYQKTGSIYSSWGHILIPSGIKPWAECSSRWLKNSLLSPKFPIYAFKA